MEEKNENDYLINQWRNIEVAYILYSDILFHIKI